MKRCGKSAPANRVTGSARQTPSGARPSRNETGDFSRHESARFVRVPGRLLEAAGNRRPREMIARDKIRLIVPLRIFFLNRLCVFEKKMIFLPNSSAVVLPSHPDYGFVLLFFLCISNHFRICTTLAIRLLGRDAIP